MNAEGSGSRGGEIDADSGAAPKSPGRSKVAIGCGLLLIALVVAPFFTVVQAQIFAVGVGAVEPGPFRDTFIQNLWSRGNPGRRALAGLFRSGDFKLREDIARRFSWDHLTEHRHVVPAGFEPLLPELLEVFAKTSDESVVFRLRTIKRFVEPREFAEAGLTRLEGDFATNLHVAHALAELPDSGCALVVRRLAEIRNGSDRARLIKRLVEGIHRPPVLGQRRRTREAIVECWPTWSPELRADFVKACEAIETRPAPLDTLIPSNPKTSGATQ